MPWWMRIRLMDKAGDPPAGGGGGGDKPPGDDQATLLKTLAEQNQALMKRLEALEGKGSPAPSPGNDDLESKARKEREQRESKDVETKSLETALKFSMGSSDWLKTNQSLLPKDVGGIFQAAEKETYANAVEKDRAVKAGIIQAFFKVQDNLDLLTSGPKTLLDDWLKLTKNAKEEKAQQLYDVVFEPAFENLKRLKKANELQKTGSKIENDLESAYREKLMKGSRKHYMGEKSNA